MKMTTIVASGNMKYNRRRNILIGISVGLTTLLLFLVISIGYNALQLQFAAVNELYPSWHAVLNQTPETAALQLKVSSGLEQAGLRYDAAVAVNGENRLLLGYFDAACLAMNHLELSEGRLPEREDEIVISEGFLKAAGVQGKMGDRLRLTYQLRTREGFGYAQEKEFTICGFLPAAELNEENDRYTAVVSKAFIEENVPEEDREYLVYVRAAGELRTTEEAEEHIYQITDAFGLDRRLAGFNEEYLAANYVDPSFLPAVVAILLIIVAAAAITIYSIYYISMVKNIREYGKLKAIGATGRQLRQVVLREGMYVALIAAPAGLLFGSLLLKIIYVRILLSSMELETQLVPVMKRMLDTHEVSLYHGWIYLLSLTVSLGTVYISLRKPMRIAAKIPPVEAIRFHGSGSGADSFQGYESVTVRRLAVRNLMDHRKRTVMTILSMAATGILYVAVATVLACMAPEDAANSRMPGEYEIKIRHEEGNKEHPEYAWEQIQKDNPLTDSLKERILALDGVTDVEVFRRAVFSSGQMSDNLGLLGLPEDDWNEVEKHIVDGRASYEDLLAGDKAVLRKLALYWYPDLGVGDKVSIRLTDGEKRIEKTVEIIAISDVPNEIAQYENLIMAEDAVANMCENNQAFYFHIHADRKYDPTLEKELRALIGNDERMELSSWEAEYRLWERQLALFNYLCFGFVAILGAVAIMNLVNTMLNSIYERKKELGILQAIGLTQHQLSVMFGIENLAYTAGTLFLSLGLGLSAGYGMFRYAKENYLLNITVFHFPNISLLVFIAIILLAEFAINVIISHIIRKEPLIERIRFSE